MSGKPVFRPRWSTGSSQPTAAVETAMTNARCWTIPISYSLFCVQNIGRVGVVAAEQKLPKPIHGLGSPQLIEGRQVSTRSTNLVMRLPLFQRFPANHFLEVGHTSLPAGKTFHISRAAR